MKRKKRAFWALFLALALIFSAFGDGGGFVYAEEAKAAEIQKTAEELPEEKQVETEESEELPKMEEKSGTQEAAVKEPMEETKKAENTSELKEVSGEPSEEKGEETPKAEEQKEHVEYTATCEEGWEIHAEAAAGVLPEGAQLKAEKLSEDSNAFARARETVEKSGVKFDGIAALDLHFEKDGQEVEPEGTVQVSVIMPDMIPEEAAVEELVISHILEEDGETRAETVAELAESGEGSISLEQESGAQTLRAEFATESFSSYTVTWQLGAGSSVPKEIPISLYAGTRQADGSYEELGDVTKQLGNLIWYTADKSSGWGSVDLDEVPIPTNLPTVTGTDGKTYAASGETRIKVGDSLEEVTGLKMVKLKGQNDRNWYVIYAAGEKLQAPTISNFQTAENVLYYGRKGGSSGWTETNKSSVNRLYLDYNTPADPLDPGSGSGSGGGATPSLAHRKYLNRLEDGSYDLTLEVTGQAGSETKPKKLDVLLILDQSGSMTEDMDGTENTWEHPVQYKDSRWYNAKVAIQQLIDTLKANKGLDVRYSIVAYSGSKETGAFQDAAVKLEWNTADKFQISKNANRYSGEGILDYTPSGGTNYQAGLRIGKQQLAYARSDAEKVVIFLSDGYPTFYYNQNGMTVGAGNADGDSSDWNGNHVQGEGSCSKAALAEATGFRGVDYFYTIGLGNKDGINADTLKNLSEKVWENNKNCVFSDEKKPYLCGNLTALKQAFTEMAGSITRLVCTDVSIRDTLSENVTLLDKSGGEAVTLEPEDYKLLVLDQNGKEQKVPEGTTVSYAAESHQLLLRFPEKYELQNGWTYRVTVHITPSDRAYEKYFERGASYKDKDGKADEGGPDTGSHRKEEGFYSNDSASVTYTYRGKEWTEGYEKPVVQLQISSILVSKTVTGNMAEENRDFTFTLTLTRKNQNFTTVLPAIKGQEKQQLTAGKDGYTFTLKHGETIEIQVPTGWSYQVKEAENEGYTAYVTVEEEKEAEGQLAKGIIGKTAVSVAFRNDREVQVPTGVNLPDLNSWLAAAAVLGAGGGSMIGINGYRRRRTHGKGKN